MRKTWDFSAYDQKDRIKMLALLAAVLLGLASLWYVDSLLQELRERESQYIELYGAAQAALSKPQVNQELTTFLFDNVLTNRHSIPSIALTKTNGMIDSTSIQLVNVHIPNRFAADPAPYLLAKANEWAEDYKPIQFLMDAETQSYQYIYYSDSELLTQLAFYPYVQLGGVIVFVFLLYMVFSAARKSEQNRIWAGLAKETAHQLGTPISSLIAWTEILKGDSEESAAYAVEIEKDIQRLTMITDRFSHIGSAPTLKKTNLDVAITQTIQYFKKRIPNKVKLEFNNLEDHQVCVMLNGPLFGWVIENLIKNAVDAMNGSGKITITVAPSSRPNMLQIDIADTGKGISPKMIRRIFRPGYTTKKRGWGLGLTLTKRIVEQYHQGKVFVQKSEKGVGTTFRIILPLAEPQSSVQEKAISIGR